MTLRPVSAEALPRVLAGGEGPVSEQMCWVPAGPSLGESLGLALDLSNCYSLYI